MSRFARSKAEQQTVAKSEHCRAQQDKPGGHRLASELRSGPLLARSAGIPGNAFERKQFIARTMQGSNGFGPFAENKRTSAQAPEGQAEPGLVQATLAIGSLDFLQLMQVP